LILFTTTLQNSIWSSFYISLDSFICPTAFWNVQLVTVIGATEMFNDNGDNINAEPSKVLRCTTTPFNRVLLFVR